MTRTITKGHWRLWENRGWALDSGSEARKDVLQGEKAESNANDGRRKGCFRVCSACAQALWSERRGPYARWEGGKAVGLN